MCAEGMDGPVSTMKQSSHRSISQSSYSSVGMGAVDEEISAIMLQSNHANMTGMMAPAGSAPLDHLAAYQQAYAMYPPGLMQRPGAHVRPALRGESRPRASGFNLEEKYLLEAKSEVVHNYNSVYESAGLHRYHSAPASAFLAEMNEPGPQQQQLLGLYGDGGLTSISENMDSGGGTNLSAEYEHYMAPENDFARRLASFPASALCKEEATTATLLRQSSVPSVGLENASDKSSSRNSDNDNNHLINGYTASMYSQEDFLWKSPTSPAKRQRGLEGESETSSGSVDGSTYRNGLVRHMSLPSPTSSPGVEGNSFTAVPMRTRAKRGCATHPRSIAERVRRTKISERMKRLQDLVPDMDKQTNTSDMLDETVEYVKSLQRKVQELTETVAQLQAAAAKHNITNLELGVPMDG